MASHTTLLWKAPCLVSINLEERPARIRKSHNKVRTGCLTCKIRRKKCDEARPSCYRCTSTGRQCNGYRDTHTEKNIARPDPKLRSATSSSPGCTNPPTPQSSCLGTRETPLQLWRPPKSVRFNTQRDFDCFDFFRCRTGPEFDAYFDTSFWRDIVLRACFSHPTVLQAATAVGAVHRRFELGISPEAFRFCDIAAEQYRKTLLCLAQDLRKDHISSREPNMLVFMLLCVFETFQGNYDCASTHMKTAITQLLRHRNLNTTHSETQQKSAVVSYDTLRDFTDRVEQQIIRLYGGPTNIRSLQVHRTQLDPIPKVFSSLEEARDVIVTEGQYVWHAWHQLELGDLQDFSVQHLHVSRLLEWSRAYAEYMKSSYSHHSATGERPYILKLYREAMYLVILTQLAYHEPSGQTTIPPCFRKNGCTDHPSCRRHAERKKALDAHFARILVVSEPFFNANSTFGYQKHSIGFDTGIGPSLHLGATTCRSTKIRYQVTSLLTHGELQDQTCHALGVYNIAEKAGSISEHALVDAGFDLVSSSKWVEITCFLEANRILLKYCQEDDQGVLLWTQKWITY